MGLFDKRDKKQKDDFDSPMERVNLSTAPAAPREPSAPVAKAPDPKPAATTTAAPAAAAPAPAAAPAKAAPAPARVYVAENADDYGIAKAIELMRTLPSENVELVVQVVKFSLESVGIKLPVIIEDAIRRQEDIQGKIAVRRTEIAELEAEIRTRRDEIEKLEADHRETTMVRERLELAEAIGKKKDAKPEAAKPEAAKAEAAKAEAAKAEAAPVPKEDKQDSSRTKRPTNPPPGGSGGLPSLSATKK